MPNEQIIYGGSNGLHKSNREGHRCSLGIGAGNDKNGISKVLPGRSGRFLL